MSQFEEYSPYMSDNRTSGGATSGMFSEANYPFGAFIIFILLLVGAYYLYGSPKSESFLNTTTRSDPQSDDDYLDVQIDLLNQQQSKNMSG